MHRELLQGFQRGDRGALAELYRIHVQEVQCFVRRGLIRMGRFSGANLADAVQEVFLKAFSSSARSSFDANRELGPFLFAIARNVLIDGFRRSRREIIDADLVDAALNGAEGMAEIDGQGSPPEIVSIVNRYVEALPPEIRAIHFRRFVLGEAQRGAAEALGISRQTLRTIERRIVEGLRCELNRIGEESTGESREIAAPLVRRDEQAEVAGHVRRR